MRMFGRWIALALVLAGASAPAAAADAPAPSANSPMYGVPIQSWTGFYLGLNGGGTFGTASLAPAANTFDDRGWNYGVQAGYLWQTGRLVIGVEADVDGATLTGRIAGCGAGCDVGNRWISTVRGRAGMALPSFLPYLTGGLAFGDLRVSNAFTGAAVSSTQTGYAIGGGLEFPLAGKWSARGEYLFVDLRNMNCPVTTCGGTTPSRASFYNSIYRAAVNLRF